MFEFILLASYMCLWFFIPLMIGAGVMRLFGINIFDDDWND